MFMKTNKQTQKWSRIIGVVSSIKLLGLISALIATKYMMK
jgi:hypothetical protein